MRSTAATMLFIAWPERMRRVHASVELALFANIFGIVRVPLVPRPWHDKQPLVLTLLSQWYCVSMFGLMPLPLSPVPGNSLLSGIFSSEYQ